MVCHLSKYCMGTLPGITASIGNMLEHCSLPLPPGVVAGVRTILRSFRSSGFGGGFFDDFRHRDGALVHRCGTESIQTSKLYSKWPLWFSHSFVARPRRQSVYDDACRVQREMKIETAENMKPLGSLGSACALNEHVVGSFAPHMDDTHAGHVGKHNANHYVTQKRGTH